MEQQEQIQKTKKTVFIIFFFQVLSGVLLTLTLKFQDKQKVLDEPFKHPIIQTLISFVGQMFNFLIYYYIKKYDPKQIEQMQLDAQEQGKQTEVPYKILAIPAIFHALCSFSGYASYYYMQASISMMMGGSLSIITAFFSYLVFGTIVSKKQRPGIVIILVGSIVLGFSALQSEDDGIGSSPILGIVLAILGLIFFALLMISEEYVLKNYTCHSTIIAGTEGTFALIFSLICFPLFNYLKPGIINFGLFYEQILNSGTVFFSCICLLLFDMIYTLLCILSVKFSNSLLRSVIFQLRCIFVWLFALFLPNPEHLGKSNWEKFSFIQLFGYLMLAVGVFSFNGNLKLPFISYSRLEEIEIPEFQTEMKSYSPDKENNQNQDSQSTQK